MRAGRRAAREPRRHLNQDARAEWCRRGHRRRWAAVAAVALAPALASHAGRAETTVRLGEGLTFAPYVLAQLDVGSFSQSRSGGQAAGFNDRRLRAGGRLTVGDQVELGFIWDFGQQPGSQQRLFEAQASYIGLKPFRFTGGAFKTNFGLESLQGAGDYLFLERASIATITRNLAAGIQRVGLQAQADGSRYIASVALTSGRAGLGDDGNQRAVVGRAAGLPIHTGETTLHVGASGEWVFRPANESGKPRALAFSDRTELQIDDVKPSLSTGGIAASSGGAFGPELALTWRRLWLQGEYYQLLVNRRQSGIGDTLTFDGYYAQAAYTLLGKPRTWKPSIGAFGAPTPAEGFNPGAGQFGAVEVGVRYSAVDLNDKNVRGGRQQVYSAVANWWPVEQLRFSLLYEHANVSRGPSPRTLNAVAGRAQFQF